MKNNLLFVFLVFCCAQLLWGAEVWGQTFTTNQDGNWATAGIWTRTNPNNCGTQHTSPPRTSSYNPACQINVVIRHDVNYNAGTSFVGGYFKSMTVENGGVLNFPSNFTVSTSGTNVGNPIFIFSEGSTVNVTGTTTFTNNSQVTISDLSNFNSDIMILEGNTNLVIDGATVTLNDLTIRNGASVTLINGAQLIVNNNLVMNGGGSTLNVNVSSTLTNNGTFDLQTGGTVNINGSFQGNNLTSTTGGGNNQFNVSGTVNLSGNLTVNGYPLNASGSGGIVVEGDIRITNSGSSSINLNGSETDLIGLGSNNCAYYNQYSNPPCDPNRTDKIPTGSGCYQVQGFPGTGSCSSNACLETFLISKGNSVKERIYIFKCSTTWTVPTDTISVVGDSLEVIDSFEAIIVAGGGGGGYGTSAGGGGAGGLIFNSDMLLPYGTSISVAIGTGGIGGSSNSVQGKSGGNSTLDGISAIGGGGGGGTSSTSSLRNGLNGGSGGGSGSLSRNNNGIGGTSIGTTPSPSVYYGFAGGNSNSNPNFVNGAGGGGAGSTGSTPPSGNGGNANGGIGRQYSISGSEQYYAGGGGGSRSDKSFGLGGSNVGGNGNSDGNGANGVNATGSGGGAGSTKGGNGGSGIVIIRSQVYRILPVEFLSFSVTYQSQNRTALLDWSTAQEWENSHFEIERAVNSVKTWETIGRVEGNGYSDIPVEYSFTDTELPIAGGNIFYKLKQVDYSGKFSYSKTKAIQIVATEGNSAWIAYPNPSQLGSEIRIELLQPKQHQDEPISISLINMLGEGESKVLTSPEEVSRMVSEWMRYKNAGLYILDIRWGNNSQQIKLLKN